MKLNTLVEIPKYSIEISHNTKTIFTGSCFAENIGVKLSNLKFPSQVNPLGINYNPISLANSINRTINNKILTEDNLFNSNGLWNNYDFHSKFSNVDKDVCLQNINSSVESAHDFLKESDILFISFGTAYTYVLKGTGNIVSNCHKQADKVFIRNLIQVEEITEVWSKLIQEIAQFNPKLKIIFTISPIRHKRNGFIANQLSKSVLFVAVNQLIDMFNNVFYFPSYEILMDELRDYRFYNDDMIHPSSFAVDYIMEKFNDAFFSIETKKLNLFIEKIVLAVNHRPFNTNTKEYQLFCKTMLDKIEKEELNLDFSIEVNYFKENM